MLKVFVSIWPAFAPFGFYRIWIAIVEWFREFFYGLLPDNKKPAIWYDIGISAKPRSDEDAVEIKPCIA